MANRLMEEFMIRLSNSSFDPTQLMEQWNLDRIGKQVLGRMTASAKTYDYDSAEQLQFELVLRSNIVKASYDLNRADAEFATFAKSRCNPKYWILTEKGGFLLREGVAPSIGIEDIFHHGDRYAFECATAMVIVLYKAMLETIPEVVFNRLFADLLLWDGHYDKDLTLQSEHARESLPGDIRYFRNPDVDPEEIEWQGENVVDLGDGTYYGHGIGIATASKIIYMLNRHRISGASRSAFLTDEILHPNFKRLATLDGSLPAMALRPEQAQPNSIKGLVVVRLGNTIYLRV
ncbi:MAG TPA: protein-glutamine gamma-glutamyltransferase [Bacillota bacterium]|nr:protein-glutamine gamma-glutamyltransferase [Bacillota bacterium]